MDDRTPPQRAHGILLARNRDYRRWFIGDTLSAVGSAVATMAVPLLIIAITDSTAVAGSVATASMILATLTLVPAGVVADTFDRRRTVIGLSAVLLVAHTALILAIATDRWVIPTLIAIVPVTAVAGTIIGICLDAMLKSIVDPTDFPSAVALNEGRSAAVQLGGTPLGGLLFSIGRIWPFLGNLVAHAGILIAVLGLRRSFQPRRASEREPSSTWREKLGFAFAGFPIIGRDRALAPLMVGVMLVNLAFSDVLTTLMYHWAATGTSPVLIGLLTTGSAAGVLLGSTVAGRIVSRAPAGRAAIVAFALCTAGAALVAAVPSAVVALAGILLAALGSPIMNAVFGGYMAASVPQAEQGRVQAAGQLIASSIMPLAPLIAGFGLTVLSAGPLLAVFAGLCLVATVVVATSRAVRTLPAASEWGSSVAQ